MNPLIEIVSLLAEAADLLEETTRSLRGPSRGDDAGMSREELQDEIGWWLLHYRNATGVRKAEDQP